MSSDWVMALDNLAAGGVVDFDAPAFLLDQPARYVGNPKMETLPMEYPPLLPDGVKLKDVPKIDEYTPSNGNLIQTPTWKKVVFGGLVAIGLGALAMMGLKGKFKMPKFSTSKFKMSDMTKFKTSIKNSASTVYGYIKKPFVWLANKVKKTP